MVIQDILERAKRGARSLVEVCGQVRKGDRVLIIIDKTTKDVGDYIYDAAKNITDTIQIMETDVARMHGAEPSENVRKAMLESDVIFGATQSSMAHTQARRDAMANGARYLSLPQYSIEQLASPALDIDLLTWVRWARKTSKIQDILNSAKIIRIRSLKGTDVTLHCDGRLANFCPGFCANPGTLGSPPDIECNIPPLEDKSEGTVVVDGSIPCQEIGLLKQDIVIKIKNGSIVHIDGATEQGKVLQKIFDKNEEKAKVLAEFGIGLNPKAKLCGRMLEDEGCLGTIHLGFGSNSTIGGTNKVGFHLDFVIRNPTVIVDKYTILDNGKLILP